MSNHRCSFFPLCCRRQVLLTLVLQALVVVLIAVEAPNDDGEAGPAPWSVDPAQVAELDACHQALIAAGVPDPRQAELLHGTVIVHHGDEKTRATGYHLAFDDDRWFLHLDSYLVAGDALRIERSDDLVPQGLADLPAMSATGPDDEGEGLIEYWQNNTRHSSAVLDAAVAGLAWLQQGRSPWQVRPAWALLNCRRLGVPVDRELAALLLLTVDGQRDSLSRHPPLDLRVDVPRYLDPMATAAEAEAEAKAEKEAEALSLTASCQMMLMRHWYRRLLLTVHPSPSYSAIPHAPLAVDRTAELLAALPVEADVVGPTPLPAWREKLQRAIAFGRLGDPPAAADLATRLQYWTGQETRQGDRPTLKALPDGLLDRLTPEQRQLVLAQFAGAGGGGGQAFGADDLPALFAHIDDPRPSRWVRHQRIHSVGDNALRVIASLLAVDPRRLVGRDPQASWDAAERAATVEALRTYAAEQPLDDLRALRLTAVPRLSGKELSHLMKRVTEEERAAITAELARIWRLGPPDLEETAIAGLLQQNGSDSPLWQAALAWPASDRLASLQAALALRRQDPEPLRRLLQARFAQADHPDRPPIVENGWSAEHRAWIKRLNTVLALASCSADPQALLTVLPMVDLPVDDPRFRDLVDAVLWPDRQYEILALMPGWPVTDGRGGRRRHDEQQPAWQRSAALTMILTVQLLRDQRPLSPLDRKRAHSWDRGAATADPPTIAYGDFVAWRLPQMAYHLNGFLPQDAVRRLGQLRHDLYASADADAPDRRQLILDLLLPQMPRFCDLLGYPPDLLQAALPAGDPASLY